MSDLPSRGIIHEHEFEEQLARLIVDLELADEFIAAAEETLAQDPESGMLCEPLGRVWYLPMCPVRGRRVSLFYTFDEEVVLLLAIRLHEIQVRTLLQHAYSELTHDTIYKPKSALDSNDPDLNRQIARSMALIETTDHIFQQVAAAIEKATADLRESMERAAAVYRSRIGEPKAIDARLSEFILAPFRKSVPLITQKNLEDVLNEHSSLIDFVRSNREISVLYESPLILIIFWLIEEDEDDLWRNWPTDPAMIRDIYTLLGLSTERY